MGDDQGSYLNKKSRVSLLKVKMLFILIAFNAMVY